MKLSLNWLRDFVDIPLLDKPFLHEIIVGHVLEVNKHPDADKLNIAKVDIGNPEPQVIVCGAPNLAKDQFVPVALPGVTLPGDFKIAQREIRGVVSNGMICSEDELGLKEERQEGILVLEDKWQIGTPMTTVLGIEGFSPKQLGDLLTIRTAEVEGVESHGDDYILDIDNKSLTHRPDLWGHYGFAHEVSTILETELKPYNTDIKFPSRGDKVKVEIKDAEICPRFCCCIVKNVKVGPSPEWMQKRLEAAGVNVINNVVDITNYVMLELGHPMHAFDRKLVETDKLIIQYAKNGQEVELIDNKTYKLTDKDPIITNGKEFLSLAGIMGGLKSGINDQTDTIIFEAANWHPGILRRSSTRTGIRSDAVQRFEKSLDPMMAQVAIEKAAELLLQICPEAELEGAMTDVWTKEPEPIKIALSYERVNSYLGVDVSTEQVKTILDSLGFLIEKESKEGLVLEVPSWRATKDVSIEADLIEEIGRIYGYDNIPCILPELPTVPPEANLERQAEHQLRQIMQGLGSSEVYNYSFYSLKDLQNALLPEETHFKLKNYLAETQSHLRASMTVNMLHSIHTNLKYQDQFSIFELGRTYKNTGEYFPAEEKKLIIACVSKNKKHQQFFNAKGTIEKVLRQYLETYEITESETPLPYAHPQQTADITFKGKLLGRIFNVHPLVKENFDLGSASIAIAAVNLGPLLHHRKPTTSFAPLPKFPDLDFDVSVTVSETVTAQSLKAAITKASPELIHAVELFDIYRGDNVESGHKSLAYRITLRNLEKTLNDQEMASVQNKVFENLEALGGKIRGR